MALSGIIPIQKLRGETLEVSTLMPLLAGELSSNGMT